MTPLRDQQAVTIATILLGLSAVFTLLYGPVVPFIPGLIDQPQPVGAAGLSAVALVAAVGVWRREAWGRVLGILVAGLLLARDLLFVVTGRPLELVSVLLDLMLLYVLIRGRWAWLDRSGR